MKPPRSKDDDLSASCRAIVSSISVEIPSYNAAGQLRSYCLPQFRGVVQFGTWPANKRIEAPSVTVRIRSGEQCESATNRLEERLARVSVESECRRQNVLACPKNRISVIELDAVTFVDMPEYPRSVEVAPATRPGNGALFCQPVERIQ